MVLPSSGGLDFEAGSGREQASYFALQPSNLSSPSSDEAGGYSHFVREPNLEHARPEDCPGLFYYYWHK